MGWIATVIRPKLESQKSCKMDRRKIIKKDIFKCDYCGKKVETRYHRDHWVKYYSSLTGCCVSHGAALKHRRIAADEEASKRWKKNMSESMTKANIKRWAEMPQERKDEIYTKISASVSRAWSELPQDQKDDINRRRSETLLIVNEENADEIAAKKWATQQKNGTFRESYLERRFAAAISVLFPDMEPHVNVGRHSVDMHIPSKNLIVEIDGTYWHDRDSGKRDSVRNQRLTDRGFNLVCIRVSERTDDLSDSDIEQMIYSHMGDYLE